MSEKKKSILLLFFSLFFIFIFLEVSLKVLERIAYNKNLKDQLTDNKYNNIFKSTLDFPHLYEHKKNVNQLVTNNEKNQSYTIITNSDGLREKQNYSKLEKSVIFLGDSIIEGSSAENEETIDSYFEKLTQIVSLNFGLSASNTFHQVKYLKHKYKKDYNTKLIVLGFCLNDLDTNHYKIYWNPTFQSWMKYEDIIIDKDEKNYNQNNKNHVKTSSLRNIYLNFKNILKKSSLIVFTYNSYQRITRGQNTKLDPYISLNKNLIFTEAPLKELKMYANQINSKLLVIIFPAESQILVNRKMKKIAQPKGQKQIIKILKKLDIEYYDLFKDFLNEYKMNEKTNLYADQMHPNPDGYKLIADKIYNEIKNKKILD